jgi:hypothetical protein
VHVLFALRQATGQSESTTMRSGRIGSPGFIYRGGRQLNFIEHLLNAAEHSVRCWRRADKRAPAPLAFIAPMN